MTAPPVKKPERVSNWLNRPQIERTDPLEKRKKLWDALAKFIHDSGGCVTSAPHQKVVRVEIAPGSSLPSKLVELGYSPTYCGVGTRITAGTIIVSINLPGR
jgi:hypothetical protein